MGSCHLFNQPVELMNVVAEERERKDEKRNKEKEIMEERLSYRCLSWEGQVRFFIKDL